MKEIALSFTPEELRELAKQLYLGGYFTINIDYDNKLMADDIMNRVCAAGFHEAAETGGFRHGGYRETQFIISTEVDDECSPLIELFRADAVEDYLPYMLADRDFREQYGTHEAQEVFNDPVLLDALKNLQNKYLQEFEKYGASYLRLQEKE